MLACKLSQLGAGVQDPHISRLSIQYMYLICPFFALLVLLWMIGLETIAGSELESAGLVCHTGVSWYPESWTCLAFPIIEPSSLASGGWSRYMYMYHDQNRRIQD